MEFLLLSKFCFCIEIRQGCIIMAILGIIGRAWAGVGNGIGWIYIIPIDYLHPWRAIISISNGVIGMGASASLLHGSIRNNKTTTRVYIVMLLVLIPLLFISTCFGMITVESDKWRDYYTTDTCQNDNHCLKIVIWTIYALALDIIDFCAYIYFWICAYSYLHKLKQTNISRNEQDYQKQNNLIT